jgi:hypothetical protein
MSAGDTHAGSAASLSYFGRVQYISDGNQIFVNELINNAIWHLNCLTHSAMYGGFASVSPFIKDPAFADEKEWRLCFRRHAIDEPVRFRAGPSRIIPYIEVPINLNAVRGDHDRSGTQRRAEHRSCEEHASDNRIELQDFSFDRAVSKLVTDSRLHVTAEQCQ